jgi:nitroreductase
MILPHLCGMDTFETLKHIIRNRRSTKPTDMNGRKIDNPVIRELLELADWAPTHAMTEPWRFFVYEGEAKTAFCRDHAELYKQNTDPEKFNAGKYEKMQQQADTVSHIIIATMKRTVANTIPAVEEVAAVAAAVQNLLLGASVLELAALWSTGGMAHHPALKQYLGLEEQDQVLGILFLGYSDVEPVPKPRKIALENKLSWKS